jgi:hypothetical protein
VRSAASRIAHPGPRIAANGGPIDALSNDLANVNLHHEPESVVDESLFDPDHSHPHHLPDPSVEHDLESQPGVVFDEQPESDLPPVPAAAAPRPVKSASPVPKSPVAAAASAPAPSASPAGHRSAEEEHAQQRRRDRSRERDDRPSQRERSRERERERDRRDDYRSDPPSHRSDPPPPRRQYSSVAGVTPAAAAPIPAAPAKKPMEVKTKAQREREQQQQNQSQYQQQQQQPPPTFNFHPQVLQQPQRSPPSSRRDGGGGGQWSHRGGGQPNYEKNPLSARRRTSYIVFKSLDHQDIAISQAQSIWATLPKSKERVNYLFDESDELIAFFSVNKVRQRCDIR